MDGVRIQIKNLFVYLQLHSERADDLASASSHWLSRSRRPHNQKVPPKLQENITAHFAITSQDLDSIMWKMKHTENLSAFIIEENLNKLNL